MELHHKLRRDPNWNPSSCNICGGMGHQAANCTNGTINWRQIYGDDAFKLKAPIYHSDYVAMEKAKEIDLVGLEKRAREYAKMRTEALGINYGDVAAKAQQMLAESASQANSAASVGVKRAAEEEAEAQPVLKSAATEEKKEEPLPTGWAAAKDAQQRTYFWHTKTKKVQWERPTADTPIE